MTNTTTRQLSRQERKEFAAFARGEFRRLLANDAAAAAAARGDVKAPSVCTVWRPAERIVVTPTPDPRVAVPMQVPGALLIPDSHEGLARFVRVMDAARRTAR